jgi:hypothetical protein
MLDNKRIKAFVQDALGCGCPEEVFRSIACRQNVRLNEKVLLSRTITIGNRLLIYVIDSRESNMIQHLGAIVSAGKKERDEQGLNRLRLVVVTDDAAEKESLIRRFNELKDKDEKIHLHVIKKEENIITAQD